MKFFCQSTIWGYNVAMKTKQNHVFREIEKYFLLLALLALIITLFAFLKPFFTSLLFAGIIATAIYPLHKILKEKVKVPESLSAFFSMILTLVLVITPFTYFFFFLAGEATLAYNTISNRVNELTAGDITLLPGIIRNSFIGVWFDKVQDLSPFSTADVMSAVTEVIGSFSRILITQSTNLLKQIPVLLIHTIIFLLIFFYFIRDGEKLIRYVNSLLPLSGEYRKEVFQKLKKLSYGVIYGLFGAAIAQGFLVGVGFYIVGISNAAFWGTIAGLFSPLPYVGVSVIWVPATIYLLITQQWLPAILLGAWCMAIVNFADNIVKPYIIGSSARIHPLALLLVLIGGVFGFGIKGLFFGPLLLTLALTFLHIYELEYKSVLSKK